MKSMEKKPKLNAVRNFCSKLKLFIRVGAQMEMTLNEESHDQSGDRENVVQMW